MGTVTKCPKCGKLIALRLPIHECKAKKADKAKPPMSMTEFKLLVKELLAVGWKMQTPDPETFAQEDKACNNAICANCGNKGLAFMPFTGPARAKPTATLSTYRAFAICSRCAQVIEF